MTFVRSYEGGGEVKENLTTKTRFLRVERGLRVLGEPGRPTAVDDP